MVTVSVKCLNEANGSAGREFRIRFAEATFTLRGDWPCLEMVDQEMAMAVWNPGLERWLDALRGLLLSFPIALFTIAVFTDITYLRTAEVQWTNFSAWLITGALVFGGLAAAWALISLLLRFRRGDRNPRLVFFALLAVMWVLGLVNAFKHSQDAWSSVGAFGLILSILCSLLAMAAGVMAFSGLHTREIAR